MFTEFEIPEEAFVEGSVTQIEQLEGTRTTLPIRKHEMIQAGSLVSTP